MISAEIDTLEDGHILAAGGVVDSEPTSLHTEMVDAVHNKKENESTQSNDSSDESSAESTAHEGDVKLGVTKSKPFDFARGS